MQLGIETPCSLPQPFNSPPTPGLGSAWRIVLSRGTVLPEGTDTSRGSPPGAQSPPAGRHIQEDSPLLDGQSPSGGTVLLGGQTLIQHSSGGQVGLPHGPQGTSPRTHLVEFICQTTLEKGPGCAHEVTGPLVAFWLCE